MQGTEGAESAKGMTYIGLFWLAVVGTQPIRMLIYRSKNVEGMEGSQGAEGMEGMTYIGLLWVAVVGTQPIRMLMYRWKGHRGYDLYWDTVIGCGGDSTNQNACI